MNMDHTNFMKIAIQEGEKAAKKGEVPVGATLVTASGKILSAAHNQTITLSDPSAHAEIMALRESGRISHNYRLLDTLLYVTIEPCVMCMGAIIHARVKTVVFGAKDPKWGAAGSLYNFANDNRLNHSPEIISGVCADQCRELIQKFFKTRRKSIATNAIMT